MANSFTGLLGSIYQALDIVSREPVGLVQSVTKNSSGESAALNQSITIPVVGSATTASIVPGMTAPQGTDKTISNTTITITKSKQSSFNYLGEEVKGLNNGVGQNSIQVDQIAQAIRALTNEVETDIAGLYAKTSRAVGTAGTTPFANNVGDSAQARKLIIDNGAPSSNLKLVVDTAAGANLRTLAQLTKANEAGSTETLRRGVILDQNNFQIRESGAIGGHTQGTGTGYTSNTAGYAVGATAITLLTGSGTVLAGDVVTFAGDTNKYKVATGVAAPGVLTLAAPGLRQALPASAVAMTIGATSSAENMFFDSAAIQLITRAPAEPAGGDSADDRISITDPVSGITYNFTTYRGYKMNSYFVELAWGFELIKPEHAGVLLG